MKIKASILIIIIIVFSNMKVLGQTSYSKIARKKRLSEIDLKDWQHKDIFKDTIAGVSLDRAYQELLKKKKAKPIIVAVVDTEVDIDHEDLKQTIWTNKKEIPNNGIDDDHNGYIDDVHGWNFLGSRKGESALCQNTESSRIIKYFKRDIDKEPVFKNKKDSLLYQKALVIKAKDVEDINDQKGGIDFYTKGYPKALAAVKRFFPDNKYTISKIDSVYRIYRPKDEELSKDLYFMKDVMRHGYTQEWVENYKKKSEYEFSTTYNENYYDRSITGDDENDINDKYYGSNDVSKNAKWVYHATQVSGLIGANRQNNTGIKGFSDAIKIMPVVMVAAGGSEHDKDVALAIRYAVDNGAKVINMSFGKTLSLHEDWVIDAIKYAEKKDVLIIAAAGNSSENADEIISYPTDYDTITGKEFCNNFINVGASNYNVNEYLPIRFSNYGKKNVDIFAPGYYLYTSDASEKYVYNDGTSLACAITSGTAALIRSYYPKLTAPQVKQIILDSGVSYDIEVIVPGTKDKKLKFSELSKSGKVVNVYNAMIMASTIRN
jgi:cell wall-associated protease